MKRRIVLQSGVTGAEILDWLKSGREDFACHDASCAPPPVGTGGSAKGAKVISKTKDDGGATLNPRANLRAVTSGYSVSEHPEASFVKDIDSITAADVDSWMAEHRTLLAKKGNHVGAWHDTDTGKVWLDVVSVYPNTSAGRQKALASARVHNQIAIFHLDTFDEIPTGGTGEKLVAALIAACYSRACAPPPIGSGGSVGGAASILSRKLGSRARTQAARSNSSVYPVDTHPVTKASDDHPIAPGADNLEAVRGYRGQSGDQPERRIPRQGETVDIYRDLGRGKEHRRGFPDHDAFSVRLASATSGNQTTQVVASTVGIELDTPRPSWAHSAKAEAETSGKRGVHGFLRGEVRRYLAPAEAAQVVSEEGWQKVSYYPGTQDFFLPGGRERVVGGDRAVLHRGEFHMLNPQTVTGADPAPVSAIERRTMAVVSALLSA